MKLVYDVGINDKNGFKGSKEYNLWLSMLGRCYSPLFLNNNPTYRDCYVSDGFKTFSKFYNWCQEQVGFNIDDFELDKDLLIKGNKIYSESMAVFLPRSINIVLSKRNRSRGELPIGVSFYKRHGLFESYISIDGKKKHLGRYSCKLEAFNAYKREKEKHIKRLAMDYRSSIDPRAYTALMQYTVEIND